MKMMPKRVKFRKSQRGTMKGPATRGNKVSFGEHGIQSLEISWITAQQIEACRMVGAHIMGKEGRLYIRIFPHKSVTAKPADSRMGKGKGEPEYYVAVVRPGTVMFEVAALPLDMTKRVFNAMAHKLPVKTKMVHRRHSL